MADISSIRSTAIQTLRVALLLQPRLLAFILLYLIFLLLFYFENSYFYAQSTQDTSLILFMIFSEFILTFGDLLTWSWILSGWVLHELVADGTPHPLSAGKHLRALCWHQCCAISVSVLFVFLIAIPFMVLGTLVSLTIFGSSEELFAIYEIGDFGKFVILFIILAPMIFIPVFITTIFYLRYSVGILSLTLYGKKMSLGRCICIQRQT